MCFCTSSENSRKMRPLVSWVLKKIDTHKANFEANNHKANSQIYNQEGRRRIWGPSIVRCKIIWRKQKAMLLVSLKADRYITTSHRFSSSDSFIIVVMHALVRQSQSDTIQVETKFSKCFESAHLCNTRCELWNVGVYQARFLIYFFIITLEMNVPSSKPWPKYK